MLTQSYYGIFKSIQQVDGDERIQIFAFSCVIHKPFYLHNFYYVFIKDHVVLLDYYHLLDYLFVFIITLHKMKIYIYDEHTMFLRYIIHENANLLFTGYYLFIYDILLMNDT